MSASSHEEEHSSFIKTPQQLIVVILVGFLVPIAIAVMASQFFTSGFAVNKDNPAMSPEEVAKRLKPVGELVVAEAAPAAEEKPGAPAAVATAAGSDKGKSVFASTCGACHSSGAAGAPKLGDKAAWAPRIATGKPSLYHSALKGKNVMPPKGGNASLSDDDVKAAVDYMVSQVK